MSEHVNGWLAAYFDGELGERRARLVRDHLDACSRCREQHAALSKLRLLLGESPEAQGLLPAKQFAGQVALRLARRPSPPLWSRAATIAWGSIPALLLAAWVFAQALFLVLILSGLLLDLGLWGEALSDPALIRPFSPADAVLWNVAVSAVIGLVILSWLASWWIRQQNGRAGRATE